MKPSNERRRVWVRVCGIAAAGLAAGVIAAAQDSERGRAPGAPPGGLRFVRLTPALPALAPSAFDPCLVQAPNVDPRFVVPARAVDESMIVPARVAGLYRGALGRRP